MVVDADVDDDMSKCDFLAHTDYTRHCTVGFPAGRGSSDWGQSESEQAQVVGADATRCGGLDRESTLASGTQPLS